MNAHVSTESLLAATCPAADLCDELAAAQAAYKALDAEFGGEELGPHERATVSSRIGEIVDLEDRLLSDAEYVTPTSARGAILAAVLMGRAARAALAPDGETDEDPAKSMRRFHRLQARLLEYLTAASGATLADLGLDAFHFAPLTPPGASEVQPAKTAALRKARRA